MAFRGSERSIARVVALERMAFVPAALLPAGAGLRVFCEYAPAAPGLRGLPAAVPTLMPALRIIDVRPDAGLLPRPEFLQSALRGYIADYAPAGAGLRPLSAAIACVTPAARIIETRPDPGLLPRPAVLDAALRGYIADYAPARAGLRALSAAVPPVMSALCATDAHPVAAALSKAVVKDSALHGYFGDYQPGQAGLRTISTSAASPIPTARMAELLALDGHSMRPVHAHIAAPALKFSPGTSGLTRLSFDAVAARLPLARVASEIHSTPPRPALPGRNVSGTDLSPERHIRAHATDVYQLAYGVEMAAGATPKTASLTP
jgi:hypothetical protein